jgi:hypothetical protein
MRTLATLVLVGFTTVGCAKNSANEDSAAAAIDSSSSVESEGNVMMAVSDGADGMALQAPALPTPEQVAQRIAANVPLRWSPSGCATSTVNGADVTITFNDCTGPRGLLHVTGELDLVASVGSNVVVTGTATNFEVNRATLDIDSTATYSSSGTTHSIAVATTGTGVGALGNAIDHQGNYTVTWDTASTCGSIAGMWSTEISTTTRSATRSNDVNLMRCAGGCPTGTLVHTGLGGVTLTVTFDGTATASWTTSGGKSGTFGLQCQ